MRSLLLTLLFSSLLYATSNIDTKIKSTSKELQRFDKTYSKVHQNLASTAKQIIRQERTILRQQKKLQQLQLELSLKEQRYQENLQEVKLLKKTQEDLQQAQEKLRQDLAFMLAKNVSLSLIMGDGKAKNNDSLITEEVFSSLNKITRKNISSLQNNFSENSKKIDTTQVKISSLKVEIDKIDAKQKEVISITNEEKENLAKLKLQKNEYRTSVKKLLEQQNSLKSELSKLNIIKKNEAEKRRAEEQEKIRLAKLEEQQSLRAKPTKALPQVKSRTDKYDNSVKTKTYRGKKTIAPLDDFTVVKKFGPYEDPIYHIKIFNESISLKPKSANANVKNVLNGKVILAKETALLNNIVIIEHDNGMHTIYAHLDKIAPTIQKGKRLKQGSIIGRVNDELMFEVTQKNYHINPLQLISTRL